MTIPIGICMATFNGAMFLHAQLASIAAQIHTNWHLYIRDDGSQDESRQIAMTFAEQHPGRVTFVQDDGERLGVKGNFACLMQRVREPYIAFSDQDDIWHPDKLAQAAMGMRRTERRLGAGVPVMVHADRRLIDAEGREIAPSYWASRGLDAARFNLGTCLAFCLAAGSTMLINRALLERALPVPEAARMHDTWLELVAHAFGDVTVLDEIALDFRRHGANASGSAIEIDSHPHRRFTARAKRFLKGMDVQRRIYTGYVDQAAAFQQRYGAALASDDQRRLARFLALPRRGVVGRLIALGWPGATPPGLLRQVALVLALPRLRAA